VELAERAGELAHDRPIAAASRAGSRSAQATVILREAGFSDVANLAGGMLRWRAEGMLTTMRDREADAGVRHAPHVAHEAAMEAKSTPQPPVPVTALLSFLALGSGLAVSAWFS
jgi:hypothetical protein